MSVRIELPLKEQDLDDFKIFCKINKYLKTVHVNLYNRNDLISNSFIYYQKVKRENNAK